MTRNGVRLGETPTLPGVSCLIIKKRKPFCRRFFVFWAKTRIGISGYTQPHAKRSGALTTRPLPKQLITETATHGCAVFLVARFKIGHTRRKLPVTQTATSRFNAYRADAPGICRSIRLCSHADIIIYKRARFVKRFFAYFLIFFGFFMPRTI